MGKQVEVVILEVLRETAKALQVRLYANARYGQTDVVTWLPKSLMSPLEREQAFEGAVSSAIPAWKGLEIERTCQYGTVVCLPIEEAA